MALLSIKDLQVRYGSTLGTGWRDTATTESYTILFVGSVRCV